MSLQKRASRLRALRFRRSVRVTAREGLGNSLAGSGSKRSRGNMLANGVLATDRQLPGSFLEELGATIEVDAALAD